MTSPEINKDKAPSPRVLIDRIRRQVGHLAVAYDDDMDQLAKGTFHVRRLDPFPIDTVAITMGYNEEDFESGADPKKRPGYSIDLQTSGDTFYGVGFWPTDDSPQQLTISYGEEPVNAEGEELAYIDIFTKWLARKIKSDSLVPDHETGLAHIELDSRGHYLLSAFPAFLGHELPQASADVRSDLFSQIELINAGEHKIIRLESDWRGEKAAVSREAQIAVIGFDGQVRQLTHVIEHGRRIRSSSSVVLGTPTELKGNRRETDDMILRRMYHAVKQLSL